MNIQDLVRERVIGNIKTGKKDEKGISQKLDINPRVLWYSFLLFKKYN